MKLLLRVRAFERAEIIRTLEEHDWNYTRAAKILVVNRTDFYKKLRKYGITRPASHPCANRGNWSSINEH